ncbi:MAG: hypothetical protein A3G33_07560 [Omnitrophica bacterium RIFCSPLOWO2_12_FULL_44_17]|uniref:RNA polymerase sigma-70 region 2 domain-containing protein n=1 Tax=Candidatus Danuiimicrobium aquiferis TaxID=1801832 RepID=A0A1G1KYT7_9BACT|nr:MAG: hypothetical protein A3B72_07860 [Omnitrophica bacterium RIFCSPHIGHO2_02_FULL_45_28]OGW92146.1 MAG: hypothetical protein A3E74_10280 [Omnitrophica bacterium RIFCSPHIGHO2_12_FULL_44_12]OGW98076.1 MAG: hypothetical protein A3G33_07560 [Omnitrophica bacterium RIFCSPLOWO2_12_FULL_44_17]OGX03482.1 MAG: hypothetical protein A3J12_02665 [Omnitrophica bacterium RIFCSPLOWO2_02_FULL_44_11]
MKEKANIEEEKRLIAACLRGDGQAWGEFITKYNKLIYSSIYRALKWKNWTPDPDLVKDLYQGAFEAILEDDYEKIRQFGWENGCSFATWLGVIVRNRVIDFVRKESKRSSKTESLDGRAVSEEGYRLIDRLKDDSGTALETLTQKEKVELLEKAIETLDENDKVFVKLLLARDFSHQAVARLMGKSLDAVYMQKKRVLEKLKRYLKNYVGF